MADAPAGGGNVLTRKYGPLPAWAWAGIVGVGVFVFVRYRASKAGGAGTDGSTSSTAAPDAGAYADVPYGDNSGAGYGSDDQAPPANTAPPATTGTPGGTSTIQPVAGSMKPVAPPSKLIGGLPVIGGLTRHYVKGLGEVYLPGAKASPKAHEPVAVAGLNRVYSAAAGGWVYTLPPSTRSSPAAMARLPKTVRVAV